MTRLSSTSWTIALCGCLLTAACARSARTPQAAATATPSPAIPWPTSSLLPGGWCLEDGTLDNNRIYWLDETGKHLTYAVRNVAEEGNQTALQPFPDAWRLLPSSDGQRATLHWNYVPGCGLDERRGSAAVVLQTCRAYTETWLHRLKTGSLITGTGYLAAREVCFQFGTDDALGAVYQLRVREGHGGDEVWVRSKLISFQPAGHVTSGSDPRMRWSLVFSGRWSARRDGRVGQGIMQWGTRGVMEPWASHGYDPAMGNHLVPIGGGDEQQAAATITYDSKQLTVSVADGSHAGVIVTATAAPCVGDSVVAQRVEVLAHPTDRASCRASNCDQPPPQAHP